MDFVSEKEYVAAVQKLVSYNKADTQHIFLATEDPVAMKAFKDAAPPNWKIYVDTYNDMFLAHRQNRWNGNYRMSAKLKGLPGRVALASLLVAAEADGYVLTTKSNWSRMMNELRKNIVDPRLGPTRLIDLREGEE